MTDMNPHKHIKNSNSADRIKNSICLFCCPKTKNRSYSMKEKTDLELPKEEKKKIYKDMRSLVFYRTGQVVINGTDAILISAMIGVAQAGI